MIDFQWKQQLANLTNTQPSFHFYHNKDGRYCRPSLSPHESKHNTHHQTPPIPTYHICKIHNLVEEEKEIANWH